MSTIYMCDHQCSSCFVAVLCVQAVGMLQDSAHLPQVKDMLHTASRVLGYDLLQRCLEGEVVRGMAMHEHSPLIIQTSFVSMLGR